MRKPMTIEDRTSAMNYRVSLILAEATRLGLEAPENNELQQMATRVASLDDAARARYSGFGGCYFRISETGVWGGEATVVVRFATNDTPFGIESKTSVSWSS